MCFASDGRPGYLQQKGPKVCQNDNGWCYTRSITVSDVPSSQGICQFERKVECRDTVSVDAVTFVFSNKLTHLFDILVALSGVDKCSSMAVVRSKLSGLMTCSVEPTAEIVTHMYCTAFPQCFAILITSVSL
jgi:hypothetical protein